MQFELPLLHAPESKFSLLSMLGTAWILNVWASWCAPCVAEHPVSELGRHASVVGIDYMDRREDAIAWLRRYGDPFRAALFDSDGRLGVKGVPATFVIDKKGVVRCERTGPITPEIAAQQILPLIAKLEREQRLRFAELRPLLRRSVITEQGRAEMTSLSFELLQGKQRQRRCEPVDTRFRA